MTAGTSVYAGRIQLATSTYAAAAARVGPKVTKGVTYNNLAHFADSFGQRRLAFVAAKTAVAPKAAFLTPRTTGAVADTWYQVTASAAFPIPLRADGSSYKIRVRLGGASDNGHAVKFAMVLAPVERALSLLSSATSDSVFETDTTTSATPAWLTGASHGTSSFATMVGLTSEEAASYLTVTSTPVDLAGVDASVQQCLVSLTVFASTANVTSTPELWGAIGDEWVGP